MRRRSRPLITSPLDWVLTAMPVAPPIIPVLAERGGTQIRAPKPILLVDTREQTPFDFAPVSHWFDGIEKKALQLGDYSIAGMEEQCVVERKSLSDLVSSLTTERSVFIQRLRRMSRIPYRLLVIDAALSQVKSRYEHSGVDPNRITQSLIAALVGLGVPFVCADTHLLGAEIVASYLYQTFLYHWLETNDFGAYLADEDL